MQAPSNAATQLGALGKYSLIASLGQGGMAKVYLALVAGPAGLNKLLVVKALREDMVHGSEDFVQMFLDEARLAARLSHPNIVQTYEVGESEGRYFIAMEYLEGQPLRTVQRRLSGSMPIEEELRIIAQTARGLHYAHDLKGFGGEPLEVVHRDVSPQNVFLTYDGQVKLLDFGIAKTQGAQHLTQVGVIKGKIDYIAPEQVRGDCIDRRADIFPLGVMMWDAVTGKRFAGGDKVLDVTKIHARVTGTEQKLEQCAPHVHEELRRIINKALALDPRNRYETAAQLADDIEQVLEAQGKKPSARSLSGLIAPLFESERAKMRHLIDQQIRAAQRHGAVSLSDTTGSLPRLGRTLSGTPPGINPREPSHLTESGYLNLRNDNPPRLDSSSSSYSMPGALDAFAQPTRRRGVPRLVALVIVAVSMIAALFLALRSDPEATKQTASSASPAAAPAGSAVRAGFRSAEAAPGDGASARETVRIHIDASPPAATVTLDGSRLPKLPFTAQLARDGTMHHIQATLAGYETQKLMLPFDAPRELHIALTQKAASPKKRAAPRVAAAPKPAEPATPQVLAPEPKVEARGPVREQNKTTAELAPGSNLNGLKPRVRTGIDMQNPYAD